MSGTDSQRSRELLCCAVHMCGKRNCPAVRLLTRLMPACLLLLLPCAHSQHLPHCFLEVERRPSVVRPSPNIPHEVWGGVPVVQRTTGGSVASVDIPFKAFYICFCIPQMLTTQTCSPGVPVYLPPVQK